MPDDLAGFEFEVLEARALSSSHRTALLALFDANYRDANAAFLDRSLATLRHVALGYRDELPVGFALGEARVMDLPRLADQVVHLAGICCIAPNFRRRGLLIKLELLASSATETPEAERRLVCGRMAHPAALRSIGRLPGLVPRADRSPTVWQQEVGTTIAEAYGSHGFDPRTFVCIGDGRPIGYPRIEFEVEPHEWKVFEPVDRDRGDALLGVAWAPNPPSGWEASI
jgi:hypothetical protein